MEELIARKYICKLTNQEVPEDKSLVSLLCDGEILGKICNELQPGSVQISKSNQVFK